MYKRVLVATGGSPWSDAAVAYAIAWAACTQRTSIRTSSIVYVRRGNLLLPGPYFLVTCTLPEAQCPVARAQQHCLSHLLFQTSAAALQTLVLDSHYLGGQAAVCIHHFLQHRLPRGCITVRSYGVLSPSRRNVLPQIRTRLAACPSNDPAVERVPRQDGHQRCPAPAQERRCRIGDGPLVFLVRLSPHPREPPEGQREVPIIQGWCPVGPGARQGVRDPVGTA